MCPPLVWQVLKHVLSLLSLHIHSRLVTIGDRGCPATPGLQSVMNLSQGDTDRHRGTTAVAQQGNKLMKYLLICWSVWRSPRYSWGCAELDVTWAQYGLREKTAKLLLSKTSSIYCISSPPACQDHFIYCLKSLMEIEKSPRLSLKCAVGTSGKTKFITGKTKTILSWVVRNQFGTAVAALQCHLFLYKKLFSSVFLKSNQ